MALEEEIQRAARQISTDGYDMSIGELISLYKEQELIINPAFQRLFRWETHQKSKFIESILLGIPIPAVFVFTTENGNWELVDGLQRLSTIFEFVGILKKENGGLYEPSILEGTKLLPSLAGKRWEDNEDEDVALTKPQQLEIRRARMRVEILKKESDPLSKYELFQRLNTGGSPLTEQEVRNAIMLMVNRDFFDWVTNLANFEPFKSCNDLSEGAEKTQKSVENVVKFVAYRNVPYNKATDIHAYLDDAVIKLANTTNFDYSGEEEVFKRTFTLINEALGEDAFKKYDQGRFLGKSLIAAYEVISLGISKNLDAILALSEEEQLIFIKRKAQEIWSNSLFRKNSGAGVPAKARLVNLLPISADLFRP